MRARATLYGGWGIKLPSRAASTAWSLAEARAGRGLRQRCAAAFDDLELGILLDIARRIANANYMTEGAQWQAERAQALGASRKHLAARMEQLMADAAPR